MLGFCQALDCFTLNYPLMHKRKKYPDNPSPQVRSGIYTTSVRPILALAGAAVIAVAAFAAYFHCLSGGFIVDDDKLLTDNQLVMATDGLHKLWCTTEALDYWPATNTTLWTEWRLWSANSTGYHVTNLILHVVEALLIWVVLRSLSIPGAFLAGMIFAIHPVNVESVAWISQRKNIMAMLFFLLSISWYLKHLSLGSVGGVDSSRHAPLFRIRSVRVI